MLAALIPVLGPLLEKVLGAFIPDTAKRQEAIIQILTMFQQSDQAQLQVNAAEAANQSVFVSGWRPFIGWICGVALLYTYILVPFTLYVASLTGHTIPKPPVLDQNLWELMFGMLGMAGLRSFEKVKGLVK